MKRRGRTLYFCREEAQRAEVNITMTEATARTTLDIRVENMTRPPVRRRSWCCRRTLSSVAWPLRVPATWPRCRCWPRKSTVRSYNQRVGRIKDPALVEFAGFNLIRTSVFPIEPWAHQCLFITYEHLSQVQGSMEITIYDQAEVLGSVRKPDLASSGHLSAWLHPAASTIKQTSPASPSLPGEKFVRSRADDGVFRQSLDFSGPFGVSTDLRLNLCKSDTHNRACLRRWVSCL